MGMKLSLLERIFFKIKDDVEDENKNELSVTLIPRFGKVGMFVWYLLDGMRGEKG